MTSIEANKAGAWTLDIAYFVNDSTIVPTLRKTDL